MYLSRYLLFLFFYIKVIQTQTEFCICAKALAGLSSQGNRDFQDNVAK